MHLDDFPETTFGIFEILYFLFSGSSLSGEKLRKTSFPRIKFFFLNNFKKYSSVVPGYEVLSFENN